MKGSVKGPGQENLYTISEAANFLGLSLDTVRTQRRCGNFPPADDQTERGWDLWKLDTLRNHLIKRNR